MGVYFKFWKNNLVPLILGKTFQAPRLFYKPYSQTLAWEEKSDIHKSESELGHKMNHWFQLKGGNND